MLQIFVSTTCLILNILSLGPLNSGLSCLSPLSSGVVVMCYCVPGVLVHFLKEFVSEKLYIL